MKGSGIRLRAYAFGHFAVDFACFYILYINFEQNGILPYFLIYNLAAFALQPLWGALADRMNDPRPLAIAGLGLIAAGTFINALPLPAMILAAAGNAIYHPAGAAAAMRHCPSDERAAGIYVAPGALGTALGMLAGKSLSVSEPLMLVILLVAMACIWASSAGASASELPEANGASAPAVILCLISIALRAFIGSLAVGIPNAVVVTALAIYCGKRFGGSLTARIPSNILGAVAVLAGTALMAAFPGTWWTVAGLFLFNLAMPLTLGRVMGAMPRNAGFGFGLTALFLVIGVLPLSFMTVAARATAFMSGGLATAVMLFVSLPKGNAARSADRHGPDNDDNDGGADEAA